MAELGARVYGGEPEAELVAVVVAAAARAVALDERGGAEVLEARPGAGEGLAPALRARRRVLDKIK